MRIKASIGCDLCSNPDPIEDTAATTRSASITEVTGRDWLVVNKALAYAVECINSLPPEYQEFSDCQDMVELLEARLPSIEHRSFVVRGVKWHTKSLWSKRGTANSEGDESPQ